MSVRFALLWTGVTFAAAVAATVFAMPFTGTAANAIGTVAAAAVCLIGIATAPTTTRKDRT